MKKLYACRPCSFGGHRFFVGEEIPEQYVTDCEKQQMYGSISIVDDGKEGMGPDSVIASAVKIHMSIDGGEGTMKMDPEQIERAVSLMQMDAKGSTEAIGGELDVTVLLFIKNVDSRKMVREAADKQLTILTDLEGEKTLQTGTGGHTEVSGK